MARMVAGDALRFVAVDLIADFLLFPLWWYTAGFVRAIRAAGDWLGRARQAMAVGLWVRNIFVPMFAQYDLWGRIISFLVRFWMIVFRSIGVSVASVLALAVLALYLAFPFVLAALIVSQILGLLTA